MTWEDLEIGVFNCGGELLAIEDRCSHDDGAARRGRARPGGVHDRVPAPRLAVRPAHRQADDAARLRPRRHLSRPRRGRPDQAGGRLTWPRPTPPTADRRAGALAQGHQLRLHRALRLPRRRELPVQGAEGPDPRARREDLRVQERAAVDARVPPQGARPLPRHADADVGLADAGRGRLRQHPLLRPRVRARPSAPGTTCPRTSRRRSTASASPRPSASSWPASARSTSPRSSTTRSTRSSRSRA